MSLHINFNIPKTSLLLFQVKPASSPQTHSVLTVSAAWRHFPWGRRASVFLCDRTWLLSFHCYFAQKPLSNLWEILRELLLWLSQAGILADVSSLRHMPFALYANIRGERRMRNWPRTECNLPTQLPHRQLWRAVTSLQPSDPATQLVWLQRRLQPGSGNFLSFQNKVPW